MDSITSSPNASGPSHDNRPDGSWRPPTSRRGPSSARESNGGIDHSPVGVNAPATALQQDMSIPAVLEMYDKQFLPGQHKSLSGIATRSFILGCTLTLSLSLALHLLLTTDSPLWRVPFFISILSLFHFLEFWTTARYNTRAAQISSFLLSQNGSAYNIAHTTAIIECCLSHYFFPDRQWLPPVWHRALLFLGLGLVVLGQAVRSGAMIAAGTNFNHIIQRTKASSHQLVTTGIYGYLRHPSYFGFFWWGLGTQLVLGNPVCFVGFAVVLWRFFYKRIQGEEKLLVGFFGDDYVAYRKRTQVGIPFIR